MKNGRGSKHNLGKTMLKHCKGVLGGVFSLAQNQKILRFHPLHGAKNLIPKKAAAPRETHAATPDEVVANSRCYSDREG